MRKATIVIAILLLGGLATAQTSLITTLFNSNNGRSTALSTSMFDVTVLNSAGVKIESLDVNIRGTLTNVTLDVYTAPLTYVGKELTPTAWTKVASGVGTAAPMNSPTPVDISDFTLAAGAHGMAIHYATSGNAYTNGTGTGPGGNQQYKNADLQLDLGITTAGLFSSTLFSPRVWNGTIYYTTTGSFTCNASAALSVGTPGSVDLSGGPASDYFLIAASLGNTTTINLGACSVSLDVDEILKYSLLIGVPIFNGYSGTLVAGVGAGTFAPPNMTALIGHDVYHAAVAYDLSGITACTNTVKTTLTK